MIVDSNASPCLGPSSEDDVLEFRDRKPLTYQGEEHDTSIIPVGSNHDESAIQLDEGSAPPRGCQWYSWSNGVRAGRGTNAERSPASAQCQVRLKTIAATSSTQRRAKMSPEERQRRHREAQRQFVKRKRQEIARIHGMVRVYERLLLFMHLIVQSRRLNEEKRRLQFKLEKVQRSMCLHLHSKRQFMRSGWSTTPESESELPWGEILQCLEDP